MRLRRVGARKTLAETEGGTPWISVCRPSRRRSGREWPPCAGASATTTGATARRRPAFPASSTGPWPRAAGSASPCRRSMAAAGLGVTEAALMMHTVARHGGAMAAASSLHINMFGPHPIVVHGTPEQKARWIPPLVAGTDQACFGFTEPNAGLDTTSITTFARRVPGGYRVNGRKIWTSTAQVANKVMLLTRTTRREDAGAPDGRHHAVLHRPRPDAGGGPAHPEDGPRRGRFRTCCSSTTSSSRRRTGSARKAAASPTCSTA